MPEASSIRTALTFHVGGIPFGLRVAQVREVVPFAALRAVPEMPRLLAGFLELDRQLIPILNLADLLRLDLADGEWRPGIDDRILIARTGETLVGWGIEHAASVIAFADEDLARLPPGHSLNECAAFVIPRQPPDPSIVLLDVERLLLEKERACVAAFRDRIEERLSALGSPS